MPRTTHHCLERTLAAALLGLALNAAASAGGAPPAPLVCTLEGPARLQAGAAAAQARYTLKVHNPGSQPVQLLRWATPFEPAWFAPWLEVRRNGRPLPYGGAKMKRGDPEAADYLAIAPGASASAGFELAPAFDVSAPGRYTLRPRLVLHDLLVGSAPVPRTRAQHRAHALGCNDLALDVTSP